MTTRQMGKLHPLFISGLEGDTRRYRCFHAQEQLALQGIESGFRESHDQRLLVDVLDYNLFVLHRVPYSPLIGAVIDVAHLQGKPVIFDTDDLVFDVDMYEHIGFVDTLSVDEARKYRNDIERLVQTFQESDCILTTTRFLAEEANQRGKQTYVHRNVPSTEMVTLSERAFAERSQREKDAIVIAYFSGTGSHNRDFEVIAEPLLWVLENYPQVWLHISGHLDLGPAFSAFSTRIRRAPYVSWRELPRLIVKADINLVPLEEDNPFCQGKSENKFVEAGLVGVPTIASRVPAYEFAITEGENGLLATSAEEWKNNLKLLLDEPAERRRIGESARRTVYERYLPKQYAPKLVETLQEVAARYTRSSVSPEQLLRATTSRVKRYAEQIYIDVANQEAQIASLRRMVEEYEDQFVSLYRRLARKEQTVEDLKQTIEAIMQGRVMRFVTTVEKWIHRIRGK